MVKDEYTYREVINYVPYGSFNNNQEMNNFN